MFSLGPGNFLVTVLEGKVTFWGLNDTLLIPGLLFTDRRARPINSYHIQHSHSDTIPNLMPHNN